MKRTLTLCALGLFLAFAESAGAAEGALEINQTCADSTGCFPGDAAGFPVTITETGSYVLTGNLTILDAYTTAIQVTADDVSIDLGGFTIEGPVVCAGFPVPFLEGCDVDDGTGHGIEWLASGLRVVDGTIRGMGHSGIYGSDVTLRGGHFEDLTSRSNGDSGFYLPTGSVIRNSIAYQNGEDGFYLAGDSTIEGCVAMGNRYDGFKIVGPGSVVRGSVARSNNAFGFQGPGTYVDCTAEDNDYGLSAPFDVAGFRGCSFNDNAVAQVWTNTIQLGINICNFDTSCPNAGPATPEQAASDPSGH